jgi:hypothetical protein
MSSSFVASLRKLAEDAAEAKRREQERAKLAERAARTEALRIKRKEEARVRAEARLALRKAEKEKRERAGEAERQRRQVEAIDRAELRRIEAENRKAEMEERKRREVAERVRLREIRKVQFCSEIYTSLAVAAWDGVQEVEVDDDAFDFKLDLNAFGVAVNRRNRLAKLATNALAELQDAADQLAVAASRAGKGKLAQELQFLKYRIQQTGQPKLASQISKFSEQVAREAELVFDRADKAHQSLLSDLGEQECAIHAQELAIDNMKADIGKRKRELADGVVNPGLRQVQLWDIADRIRADFGNINASYQALHPYCGSGSYDARAVALRVAYERSIRDVDFRNISAVEIIQLMRLASEREPIKRSCPESENVRNQSAQSGSRYETISELEARLLRMSSELPSSQTRLTANRDTASDSSSKVGLAKDFRAKAHSFHHSCIHLEQSLGRSLEGVDCGQLRFAEGHYIGPTMACLDPKAPAAESPIANAYAELRWLSTEDGRDFSGYMDIVLSELAKEGARSVEVTFVEGEIESKVVLGKVSLACKIRPPLLELLFSKRGFAVDKNTNCAAGETLFQLSW